MLFLTEPHVESVLGYADMLELIDLIEGAYRLKKSGKVSLSPRVTMQYPPQDGYYTDSCIRLLQAFIPEYDSAAVLAFATYHRERLGTGAGPRVLDYVVSDEVELYWRYQNHMELAAIMSARRIWDVRTAAPTGVATRWMARPDSKVLGIIGSGRLSTWQVKAVCDVRPIQEVRIYSRTRGNRESVAERLRGIVPAQVHAVESARAAVDGADVVVTVTNANQPVIDYGWLRPGAHVNVIARGECDERTLVAAEAIACSWREQIVRDEPDFRPVPDLIRSGRVPEEKFRDLDEYIESGFLDKRDPAAVTVFLSQGIGLWDAAATALVYRRARERNLGVELSLHG
jgi:ornithine cyclodeaminase/alanine dehydrogenase-like protein (mu-crystallin family)